MGQQAGRPFELDPQHGGGAGLLGHGRAAEVRGGSGVQELPLDPIRDRVSAAPLASCAVLQKPMAATAVMTATARGGAAIVSVVVMGQGALATTRHRSGGR
ncbi:hypothetical protein GCM10010236_07750 [Streptomyces eurythermus]|nr:hypothetical protein GCM10010236_07750 [Streptomyces eurythermus]